MLVLVLVLLASGLAVGSVASVEGSRLVVGWVAGGGVGGGVLQALLSQNFRQSPKRRFAEIVGRM